MPLERVSFNCREEWLVGRMHGIGGSDAAAAIGLSPWMTPVALWRLKIGADQQKDLSTNEAVQQGVRMEPAIRGFFAAKHPELAVEYHQFDILYQKERPWLYSTLDGELIKEDGTRGILEIKTATPNGKTGWSKWADGSIPDHYYVQLLHQFLSTGYQFAYLFAALYSLNGDITLREYELGRADVENDLTWLLDKETEFWRCVTERTLPAVPLLL